MLTAIHVFRYFILFSKKQNNGKQKCALKITRKVKSSDFQLKTRLKTALRDLFNVKYKSKQTKQLNLKNNILSEKCKIRYISIGNIKCDNN